MCRLYVYICLFVSGADVEMRLNIKQLYSRNFCEEFTVFLDATHNSCYIAR